MRQNDRLCQKSRGMHDLESHQYLRDLESLSNNFDLPMIYLDNEICSKKVCSMVRQDNFLYRDTNHLTVYGSSVVSKPIAFVVQKRLNELDLEPRAP